MECKIMKALKILAKITRIILTIVLLIIFIFVVVQRYSKGKINAFGYQAYTVATGSMEPQIKIGDVILIKEVDPATLKKGDVVTYEGSEGDLRGLILTHRIIELRKDEKDNKYYYITKGDANEVEDPEISQDNLRGKVVYNTVLFSFVSRLMTHDIFYYGLFIVISVYFIWQVLSIILSKDDDDDEGEEETEAK